MISTGLARSVCVVVRCAWSASARPGASTIVPINGWSVGSVLATRRPSASTTLARTLLWRSIAVIKSRSAS
jgi:hypothetical protein